MSARHRLAGAQRWVVKIGSSLITAEGQGLDDTRLQTWVDQIADLVSSGCSVALVSSGAVAAGAARLGWRQRPATLTELQAAASIGQAGLVEAYASCFRRQGLQVGQVLLTHDDVANRRRYLNARSTLGALLSMTAVPVINENDAITTEEFRVGDNDRIAALTANLLDADGVMLLTDQSGLFDADPRQSADAALISECDADDPSLDAVAGMTGGALGRGGMRTKLDSARQAARAGATTVIADGRKPEVIRRIAEGENEGSVLTPGGLKRTARENWIAGQRIVRGRVELDAGAAEVIRRDGRSLLPIGIRKVVGRFARGDLVACDGPDGVEIARGLANYDASEVSQLTGKPSRDIESILGYAGDPEFIHRDNFALV
ncbi:glutamate 5-kinase [Salinisphaera sp. USBA-960]|uniref:glutamate 5-kinase n=1 Tax=Salinisphaera orenii TaxID=856731 RepID=UPI000DBE2C45|nr:glutamate 5-kinase [Salifodinibacter halophilus]NNC25638.1 glutamate 5-kinase [Salifodinibacter halophilus]